MTTSAADAVRELIDTFPVPAEQRDRLVAVLLPVSAYRLSELTTLVTKAPKAKLGEQLLKFIAYYERYDQYIQRIVGDLPPPLTSEQRRGVRALCDTACVPDPALDAAHHHHQMSLLNEAAATIRDALTKRTTKVPSSTTRRRRVAAAGRWGVNRP